MILENVHRQINDLSERLEVRFQALKSDIEGVGGKIGQLHKILLEIKNLKEKKEVEIKESKEENR